MTVVNTENRWVHTGDGVSTEFVFQNRIFAATDLEVYLDKVKQVSGYTVSGVNVATGGTVTFAAAPAAGVEVMLLRNVPATQTTSWPANDPFPSAAQERAADKLTVLVQQIIAQLTGTVRRDPTSSSTASTVLPEPVAGRALKFAADGALTLSDLDPDAAQADAAAQVTLATAQAVLAASYASAAEAARDSALSSLDNFDDRYLGAKSADPATDNDGDPLVAGALYFNTTDEVMKLYTGSAWVAAYVSGADYLLISNALSELSGSAAAARSNIGAAAQADLDAVSVDVSDLETAVSGLATAHAWVIFNGSDGSIIRSSGIASVSRTGTGTYTVTFSTAMPDSTLAASGCSNTTAATIVQAIPVSTTSCTVKVFSYTGGEVDRSSVSVVFFA